MRSTGTMIIAEEAGLEHGLIKSFKFIASIDLSILLVLSLL